MDFLHEQSKLKQHRNHEVKGNFLSNMQNAHCKRQKHASSNTTMSGSHYQPSHSRIVQKPAHDNIMVTPNRQNAVEATPRTVEVQQGTGVLTTEQMFAEGNLDHNMTASLPPLHDNNAYEDMNFASSVFNVDDDLSNTGLSYLFNAED